MKPASFQYLRAQTVEEAVGILAENGDEAKVLAGGQSLVPAMNFRLARPGILVDINPLAELDYLRDEDGALAIGSLVRHATLEGLRPDDPVRQLLSTAARHVGHLPIRVRGTFGGSLAHADPAAEWCLISTLLDAEMVAANSTGRRTIPASEFFQTLFTTALQPDELLVETRIPATPPTTKVAFTEFSRRAGDFALTMVGVAVDVDGDVVESARIALGGVTDRPVRVTETERQLRGLALSEELAVEASEAAAAEVEPFGDIHGSAEYRRDLVRALTRRALEQVMSG